MRTDLLIYTENHARGGANRFLIDVMEVLSIEFDTITVASNSSGIYPEEIENFSKNVTHKKLQILTSTSLYLRISQISKHKIYTKKILTVIIKIFVPLIIFFQLKLFIHLLIKEKPKQVIIFNGGYPGASSSLAFSLVSRIFTSKVYMFIVSMPVPYRGVFKLLGPLIDRFIWKSCHTIITNCKSIKESLHILRGLPRTKKVKIIFFGIKDFPSRQRKKQHSGFGKQEIKFCYVGRLVDSKGLWILFEAFKQVLLIHQNIKLEIYGEGPEKESFINSVSMLGLQTKVNVCGHFFGGIENVLEDIDIFVSPSYWEGMPISIIEAMRSGVAIIATDVGGSREVISDLQSGLIIPVGSISSMTYAMNLLIENSALRENMGKAARKTYLEKFSYAEFRSKVLEAFTTSNLN
jgi:glycosyltransferase involved in cell wall biosynthesis